MNGEGELDEIVKSADVRFELGEREVEVDRPRGVDDLGDCGLHAADDSVLKTEIGLVENAVQRYNLGGLLWSDVKLSVQEAVEDGFPWRCASCEAEDC